MARWTLYTAPGSCALATHVALHEAGADFDVAVLDTAGGQQRGPAYLAINPRGRVPALATERGVLTETPALLLFIAQTFPAADLAPVDDPWARARMVEMLSYLASTVHVAHAHKRRGARWADDEASIAAMQAKVTRNMVDCARMLESMLAGGPWVLGERYSVADPYLYTICLWLDGDDVDVAAFPGILAHRERMQARPAVQRALADLAA